MERNYINSGKTRLAYLEQNTDKPDIIFFIHGNSTSANFWNFQLVAEQLEGYRLISFDLPAHGFSDGLGETYMNYSMPEIARVLADAILQLSKNNRYMLCGCSLGTNIVAETLPYLKPHGITLLGPTIFGANHPLGEIFMVSTNGDVLFNDMPEVERYTACVTEALMEPKGDVIADLLQDYVQVKAPFRSSMMANLSEGRVSDQVDLLKNLNLPVLVVFGNEEKNVHISYLDDMPFSTWNDKVYTLDSARHFVNIDRPETVNNLILEYSKSIFS
jgi:pimeloyl-ACP methyl ester carboxylesterase